MALLATLEVKGRAPKTGYSREAFGNGWVDTDHNGCDTRNDTLGRDLTALSYKSGTRDCVVVSGTLTDPYSGRSISFLRGQDTSNAVQVDHVVALSDAWQKGAQGWDEAKRVAFANDPLELLAVDGPLNAQKGDGDAATWLPPNGTFRCTYVARQVAIKATWGLWLTSAEKDAMAGILTGCPEQPLPTTTSVSAAATPPGGVVVGEPVADVPVAIPTQSSVAEPTTAAPVLEPAPLDGSAVSYVNCAAVRAAGAAPIHTGEPGYSHKLDRDGDGVACE